MIVIPKIMQGKNMGNLISQTKNITLEQSNDKNTLLLIGKHITNIFSCSDRTLIPAHMLCDSRIDCLDEYDEELCHCHKSIDNIQEIIWMM